MVLGRKRSTKRTKNYSRQNKLESKSDFDGEEHDVQSHMFRPTITNMQDEYCGDCYDMFLVQIDYKGNPKRDVVAEEGNYNSSHHNTCLECR